MPHDWERMKRQGAVLLAHLSDLHFGSENSSEVWEQVSKEIERVKPDRLFVTGDLVHTPDKQLYRSARSALEKFGVPYFVCPGNHDRFSLGNRIFIRHLVESRLGRLCSFIFPIVLNSLLMEALYLTSALTLPLAWWSIGAALVVGVLLLLFGPYLSKRIFRGRPNSLFDDQFGGEIAKILPQPAAASQPQRAFDPVAWMRARWRPLVWQSGLVVVSAIAGLLLGQAAARFGGVAPRWLFWLVSAIMGGMIFLALRIPYRKLFGRRPFRDHSVHEVDDEIATNRTSWKIGVLATDSSWEADISARGQAPSAFTEGLVEATRNKPWDLCILMVHHHLLSIRALEHERENNVLDLLNVTCMVNSGTLLEQVARAQIDLVLHGHEHAANEAIFGSLTPGSGLTRVVAAASATGNNSFSGCDISRASFNIIVLQPDRSVILVRFSWKGGWETAEHVLFDPAEVRHAQLRRNCDLDDRLLTSEVTKHVVITHDRDIRCYWRFSNWRLSDGAFEHKVWNSTGNLVDVAVRLPRIGGRTDSRLLVEISPIENEDGYVIHCEVPNPPPDGVVEWVELTYGWENGAVLTQQEIAQLKASGVLLGPWRDKGYEYETIWTERPLRSARLIVSLPDGFAGHHPEIRIHQNGPNGELERLQSEESELAGRLVAVAPGNFSVSVPFPRQNWDYSLIWRPASESEVEARMATLARQFGGISHETAVTWLEAYISELHGTAFAGRSTFALYVPAEGSDSLRCAAAIAPAISMPPGHASLVGHVNMVSLAWWWAMVVKRVRPSEPDAATSGFAENEKAVICFPIRFSFRTINPPPWGVMRIGILSMADRGHDDLVVTDRINLDEVHVPMLCATTRLLTEAFRYLRM